MVTGVEQGLVGSERLIRVMRHPCFWNVRGGGCGLLPGLSLS